MQLEIDTLQRDFETVLTALPAELAYTEANLYLLSDRTDHTFILLHVLRLSTGMSMDRATALVAERVARERDTNNDSLPRILMHASHSRLEHAFGISRIVQDGLPFRGSL